MKLTKFELERLPLAEMNAIKAGSGESATSGSSTCSNGPDNDVNQFDQD